MQKTNEGTSDVLEVQTLEWVLIQNSTLRELLKKYPEPAFDPYSPEVYKEWIRSSSIKAFIKPEMTVSLARGPSKWHLAV